MGKKRSANFGDAIWRAFCQIFVSTPLLVGRAHDILAGRLSHEAPLKGCSPSIAATPQLRVCWASESRVKKLASVCAGIASVCAGLQVFLQVFERLLKCLG